MISSWLNFSGWFWWSLLATIVIPTSLYLWSAAFAYGKWRKLNVPHVRPSVPLFGDTFRLVVNLESQSTAFDAIYRRFPGEKLCGFYQMTTPYLMIRDPALINAVLIKDFSSFTDHGVDLDPSVNLLARSLFFMNGRRWKTMRQKLSPGFTSGKLNAALERIGQCSEHLLSVIDGRRGGERDHVLIEAKEIVGKFATDVIGTTAFGLRLDTITGEDSPFQTYTAKLFGTGEVWQTVKAVTSMFFPELAKYFKLQMFPKDATDFFHSIMRDVIEHRSENQVVRNDLTQTLMQAREELVVGGDDNSVGRDKFCDLDIISTAILLFFAGAETVSTTICFCLYELALNKDVQDKLRDKIISGKEKYDGKFSKEFLLDLQYADMVINEAHRKYSISQSLLRVATQNYNMPDGSLTIERGQKIIIPMYSLHHDSKYYPNPDKFDPERFTPEEKSKRPSGTFIPFGDGPRNCIGKRFAELEIKLFLSEMLSKYIVVPCEKTDIPLELKAGQGLLKPKNEVWLSFKPITEL